jgi:hypothetical protein
MNVPIDNKIAERKRDLSIGEKEERDLGKKKQKLIQQDSSSNQKYFDRPQRHRENSNSRGDFDKIENLFYDIGYWTTKGSIDFSVGMIAGILVGIKDTLFGAVEVVKNSKNPIVQFQSKQALLNSASNDLADKDKESLSQGIKIDDDEYRQAATFIDDLYKNNGILKNNSGSIEHGEYTFHLMNLADGDRQYFISKYSSDSNIKAEAFRLDRDRNVTTTSSTFSRKDRQNSLNLIGSIKEDLKVVSSNLAINSQPIIVDDDLLGKIVSEIRELDKIVAAIEIKESDTLEERFITKKTLLEKEGQVFGFELEINKLSEAIENDVKQSSDNDRPTSQSVQVSLGKLKSLSEAVKNARINLVLKQNTANNLNIITIVKEVEFKIEQAESREILTEENTSPANTSQLENKTIIRTTPSSTSYEVGEDEIELDYNPGM